MEPIVITNLSDTAKEPVYDLFKNEVLAYTDHQVRTAFRPSYQLNNVQLTELQSFFDTQFVIPNTKEHPKESSHPVLACLNQYSDQSAMRQVQHLKSKGYKTITIGDSIVPKVHAHHNCLLLNEARDQYRAVNACFSQDANGKHGRAARTVTFDQFCHAGAQNCNYTADVGFFMHSMYDMTPTDVANIFEAHNLTKAVSFIHFPSSFYHKNLAKIDARQFDTFCDDDGLVLFSMRDFSFAYQHDLVKWRRWSTTTKIAFINNTAITIEIVKRHGPLNILNLVITTNSPPCPRSIPLDVLAQDHCLVPDITVALRRNLCKHQDDIPHILVPTHVVNHIMSYINRVADEAYKYTEVAALASGLLRSVKIGGVVYSHKWEVNADEYHRTLLSLFILGAIMRRDRTTSIGETFRHMKTWRDSFFVIARQICANIVDFFQHPFLTPTTGEVREDQINSWYVWHYHIRYFHPIIVKDCAKTRVQYTRFGDCDYVTHEVSDDDEDSGAHSTITVHEDVVSVASSHDTFFQDLESRFARLRGPTTCKLNSCSAIECEAFEIDLATVALPTFEVTPTTSGTGNTYVTDLLDLRDYDYAATDGGFELVPRGNQPPLQMLIKYIDHSTADLESLSRHQLLNIGPRMYTYDPIPCESHVRLCDVIELVVRQSENMHDLMNPERVCVHSAECTAEMAERAEVEWDLENTRREFRRTADPDIDELTQQFEKPFTDEPEDALFMKREWGLATTPPLPELEEEQPLSINDDTFAVPVTFTVNSTRPGQKKVTFEDQVHRVGPLPRGLCMMQAFAEAVNLNLSASQYIRQFREYMPMYSRLRNGVSYSPAAISDYLDKHNYNSLIASDVLPMLCDLYNVELKIVTIGQGSTIIGRPDGRKAVVYCIPLPGGTCHYSSTRPGGAADKFPALVDRFLADGTTFFEVSAAPGHCVKYVSTAPKYANVEITAGHYTPGFDLTEINDKIKVIRYQSFAHLSDLVRSFSYDNVICDAATKHNSEAIIDDAMPRLIKMVNIGGNVVIKTFANPHVVWEHCKWFEEVDTYSSGVGTEVYYILRRYTGTESGPSYMAMYDKYCQPITAHRIPINSDGVKKFHAEFFREIKTGMTVAVNSTRMKSFVVRACTGVAGSAKTTELAALLKDEKLFFIAPTNQLSIEHTTKFGVPSFTPHRAFTVATKYTHVVIDEISMFDVRYVAMFAATFPSIQIYVAGDQNQIGPFSEGQSPVTVFDYGISNNLIKSYAVPTDICDAIRNAMGLRIHSQCKVAEGLCKFTGKLESLIDYPMVVFNSETAEDMRTKGYKANTISTYQGSREPVVVFYVDAKAVQSKLINHPTHVYTALTRGTNKIVVYGETEYITKYLRLNGLVARTYEEISDIRPVNDTYVEHEHSDHAQGVPLEIFNENVAEEQAHTDATIDSLERTLVPVNPADNPYNHDPNPPPVKDGLLTIKGVNVAPPVKEFTGYVFAPHTKFVKSQVSDDPVVTIETFIKRYTKRSPKLHARTCAYITDAMEIGIMRAVTKKNYGLVQFRQRLHCNQDELRQAYVAYVERLNKKLVGGAAKPIFEELANPFDEYDEVLTFMNKRQAKYDPEPAFDAKVKAGQGIAAMSKRVNLLFAAYASLLLDKLRALAHEHGSKLLFATHGSDDDISRMFAALEHGTADTKYFCNDISEWDASFCQPMSDLTYRLILHMGCPKPLADWFKQYRSEWFMINHNKNLAITLKGHSKQFSGSPFTISENTIANAALMFAAFEFKNYQYAAFKGDDSLVKCSEAIMTTFGQNLFNQTKHKLKIHCTHNGEFAGFIVSRDGYFPDLLRKAAKFFGKVYRNHEHFMEAQKSAFACTSGVKTEKQLVEGLTKCDQHYNEILKNYELNEDALRCIFNTLRKVHNYRFEELKPRMLRPLQI